MRTFIPTVPANVRARHRGLPQTKDARSNARCTGSTDPYCPRHEPENYSEHMARHAVDSMASVR